METNLQISTKRSKKELQFFTQRTGLNKSKKDTNQLASVVKQSFNVLNVYGKKAEQLADIIAAFGLVLGEYDIDDVVGAFKKHLTESSVMPTPAEIVALVAQQVMARRKLHYKKMRMTPTAIMKIEYPNYKEGSELYRCLLSNVVSWH